MSAVLAETDRLSEVVDIIIKQRTGATLEEIVEAAKRGYITETEAVNALEHQCWRGDRYQQRREVPWGTMDSEPLPETLEETELREEAEKLLLGIINSNLPLRQRQAVELYYWDGLTQEQVAQRMGIGRGTVARYLVRATEKLHEHVTEHRDDLTTLLVPRTTILTRGSIIEFLMRMAFSLTKAHHPPFYPYQLWHRYSIGGHWADNGIYATRYVDKLPQYLADCFEHPPVIPRDV